MKPARRAPSAPTPAASELVAAASLAAAAAPPQTPAVLRALERRQQASGPLPGQLSALAPAKILVDGPQRAGRDVSRERPVEAPEGLFDFDTGVTPPVAFGPGRRVGVEGAWVVVVDLERRTERAAASVQ